MKSYKITIEGEQFKKSYLIYVIKIHNEKHGSFFYVGQTGDRNYLTARPPFRRLAGHLEDRKKSTQNQLYKGIVEQILEIDAEGKDNYSDITKNTVSKFLEKSTIEMLVFSIIDFNELIEKNEHKENVKYIENVEKHLIQKLLQAKGSKNVLNKKILNPSDNEKANAVASEIFSEVLKNLKI